MSQHSSQGGYESTGDTSTSSEYGSLDERFKMPPMAMTMRSATKRRAPEDPKEIDEMFMETLVLSPEKRLRLNTINDVNVSRSRLQEQQILALKAGRPQSRRSTSADLELSPRLRDLRTRQAAGGSPCDVVRGESALCTDSISPKFIGSVGRGQKSPRRRSQLMENGSVYSRHRLGATFSPLVAGAKMKVATPSQTLRGIGKQSPSESPRRGGLRNRNGATRGGRLLLSERLRLLD